MVYFVVSLEHSLIIRHVPSTVVPHDNIAQCNKMMHKYRKMTHFDLIKYNLYLAHMGNLWLKFLLRVFWRKSTLLKPNHIVMTISDCR